MDPIVVSNRIYMGRANSKIVNLHSRRIDIFLKKLPQLKFQSIINALLNKCFVHFAAI